MSILDHFFLSPDVKIRDLIEQTADIYINGVSTSFKDCSLLLDSFKQSLSHKQLSIRYEQVNEPLKMFIWELSAKHSGVFIEYLPTNKDLTIVGQITYALNAQGKIKTMSLFFDKAAVITQIMRVSDRSYKLSDFNVEGFSKDTLALFEAMLQSVDPPCNLDQELVNVFRRSGLKSSGEPSPEMKIYHKNLQEKVDAREVFLPLQGRRIRALYYVPKDYLPQKSDTLTLYFHGGGWVMLSPEFYDAQSRDICAAVQAPLLCIDYRLVPEHPFPATFNDCYDSYHWLATQDTTALLKQTFNKIAVAGDSAGGALAAGVVNKAFLNRVKIPAKLLLLSAVTDMVFEDYDDFNQKSFHDVFITSGIAALQRAVYLPYDYWRDPCFSPMHGDVRHFPDTLVSAGGADPLLAQNKAFIKKLKEQSSAKLVEIVEAGYLHDYQLFLPLAEVSRKLFPQIAAFINS